MPNWVENDLIVEGAIAEVTDFRNRMRGKPKHQELEEQVMDRLRGREEEETALDANNLIPYPEEFRKKDEAAISYEREHPSDWSNRPKDGYNFGGYDWCVDNWGTKWGFCRVQAPTLRKLSGGWGRLTYHFETAWSPPEPLIKKMGEMFPNLNFTMKYYEAGMGFKGVIQIEAGQVVEENHSDNYRGHRGG